MLPETPKESRETRAMAANGKTIFFIPSTPLEKAGKRSSDAPPPLAIAP
jgi:hypothetical protein